MVVHKAVKGKGKNLAATPQAVNDTMLPSEGMGSRGKAQEPVLATPATRSPALSGGKRLSTGSRSFEVPVVKSQGRGNSSGGGSEDQGGLVEDASSNKVPKHSGLHTPGTSRLATPSLRSADAGGVGPSETSSKRPPLPRSLQPCSSALKPSELPDYHKLLDGDWSELNTKELMGIVMTESCKVVNRRIDSLQPRPRPEVLKLMKGRLNKAYLKGSVVIEMFQEQPEDVNVPPQAAYAVSSLQEASDTLDEEFDNLVNLEAILNNPKEKEVLFRRMGLVGETGQSSGKAEKGRARSKSPVNARASSVKGKGADGGSASDAGENSDKLFDNLKTIFEVLQQEAGQKASIIDKCNELLEGLEIQTTAGPARAPLAGRAAGGAAPTTPHTLMLNLAKAVHDDKT